MDSHHRPMHTDRITPQFSALPPHSCRLHVPRVAYYRYWQALLRGDRRRRGRAQEYRERLSASLFDRGDVGTKGCCILQSQGECFPPGRIVPVMAVWCLAMIGWPCMMAIWCRIVIWTTVTVGVRLAVCRIAVRRTVWCFGMGKCAFGGWLAVDRIVLWMVVWWLACCR